MQEVKVIRKRIEMAPKYFPKTICQVFSGRVESNSMVFPEYSPEKILIVNTGVKVINNIPMFFRVSFMVAVLVKKTL